MDQEDEQEQAAGAGAAGAREHYCTRGEEHRGGAAVQRAHLRGEPTNDAATGG